MRINYYKKRIQNVWDCVASTAEGVLITSPENVRYLCGFTGSEGSILLSRESGFFLTDGRYALQAEEEVQNLTVIIFKHKIKEITSLVKRFRIKELAFESNHITVSFFSSLEEDLHQVRLLPCSDKIQMLRAVKDEEEISMLKEAAAVAAKILQSKLDLIRPGVSEIEIAAAIEYAMKQSNTSGPAFRTIVASGPRSALPHGVASDKIINKGDFVTVDYGVVYNGYCSDETSTFVIGRPTARQRKIYNTVKDAHDYAIETLCHGKLLKHVDSAARDHIDMEGFGKYFSHGTGHSIGLNVHEPPSVSGRSKDRALKGMVLTIEPGIYIPEWGGVRIEDTVLVTETGCEVITKLDKKLICL